MHTDTAVMLNVQKCTTYSNILKLQSIIHPKEQLSVFICINAKVYTGNLKNNKFLVTS